jgi:hypothetical protein
MSKFLQRVFIVLIIGNVSNASAMYEHDEEDLKASKKTPTIISSVKYEQLIQQNQAKKGIVTLCFAKQKKSVFDHVSLVFEMFHPTKNPNDITLLMIHYAGINDMCEKNLRPKIETHIDTLKLAHRAIKDSFTSSSKMYVSGPHKKYASWILPNDMLIKGLQQVEKDINEGKSNAYNCVQYVCKIMRIVGLKKVNFGWWTERAENLKCLVDDYIEPKPDNKYLL